jgi:hypothetical protein
MAIPRDEHTVPLWVGDHALATAPTGTSTPLWLDDLPGAGWYADPLDRSQLRYWSGRSWTDRAVATTPDRRGDAHGGDQRADDDGRQLGEDVPTRRGDKRAPVRAALFSAFGRVTPPGDAIAPGPADR